MSTASHPNTFPKLHNAAWPGVVGKGEGSEPAIDLDTMLDLTAAAEVDGIKFDGVDLFLFAPHVDIDATDDDLKALADKVKAKGLTIGSVVAPVWPPTGGGPAMDEGEGRTKFLEQVEKGCRIAKKLRELGVRPYGVVRFDSATGVGDWSADPVGNQAKIAETFKQAGKIARDHGEKLAAEGEICWGGMHSWRKMVDLLERVGEPETVGFQADMAHTLLYTLGENAPEDRILPERFRLEGQADPRRRPEDPDRRPPALDDRLPRRPERRHGVRLGLARPHRPALPGQRPQRQARHPARTPASGSATRTAAHQGLPAHLLGRLHVPQRGHDEAADLERYPGGDDLGAGCPRLEGVINHDRLSRFAPEHAGMFSKVEAWKRSQDEAMSRANEWIGRASIEVINVETLGMGESLPITQRSGSGTV